MQMIFYWKNSSDISEVGGYIGSSIKSEIEYAIATGKEVKYLEGK